MRGGFAARAVWFALPFRWHPRTAFALVFGLSATLGGLLRVFAGIRVGAFAARANWLF